MARNTGNYVFADLPKITKLRYFEILIRHDDMELEISKCYFSHMFHWSPFKFYENIAYHGKSKCLLEYCNEKFASST